MKPTGKLPATPDPVLGALRRELSAFPPAASIGLALSGGLDSMVLLHALCRVIPPRRVCALHVCHHLRSEAELLAELELIRSTCLGLGCSLLVHHLDPEALRALAAERGGLEDAAREFRYAALDSMAGRQGLGRILLAHHGDDDLETQVLAFVRGAGVGLLAGMAAMRPGYGRPFLDSPRSLLRDWALTHHLRWSEDSSNASLQHDRNKVRHVIIPAILSQFGGFAMARKSAGALLRQDDDCLEQLAAAAGSWQWTEGAGVRQLRFEGDFFAWHPAIRRRILYRGMDGWRAAKQGPGPGPAGFRRVSSVSLEPLLGAEPPGPDWSLRYGDLAFFMEGKSPVLGDSIVRRGKNRYLMVLQAGQCFQIPGAGTFVVGGETPPGMTGQQFLPGACGEVCVSWTMRQGAPEQAHNVVLATGGTWWDMDKSGRFSPHGKRTPIPAGAGGYWVYRTGVPTGE